MRRCMKSSRIPRVSIDMYDLIQSPSGRTRHAKAPGAADDPSCVQRKRHRHRCPWFKSLAKGQVVFSGTGMAVQKKADAAASDRETQAR